MARKNTIQAFQLLTDQDLSADFISQETSVKNLDQASVRLSWTTAGLPVGEIRFQGLQEKEGTPIDPSDWFDIDFDTTIPINSSESDHQILFEVLPFDRLRIRYIAASGAGTMNAKITAKTLGA